MGAYMLATMPGMFANRRMNMMPYAGFNLLTVLSFWVTGARTFIDGRSSMIPHHSDAILTCREADIQDAELVRLCGEIIEAQRREIEQMEAIGRSL